MLIVRNLQVQIQKSEIPPELIKLSAKVLSKSLAIAINNSFNKEIFPVNAKIVCLSSLDKHTDDKQSVTNFRPVSVLNTFSKIYEKIVKYFLINKMEHSFSPSLSAYRRSFSTEHVLIRLLEDWRNKLDNNNVVVAVLTDLSKTFDCITQTYWQPNLMHMISIEIFQPISTRI